MPTTPYTWTKTNVDIMVKNNDDNQEVRFKNIEYFFKKIDVKGVAGGCLRKLFDNGFDTIGKIFDISISDILKIPGFKEKSASNIVDAIKNVKLSIDCITLMDASNIFGRGIGSKKIELILHTYNDIIDLRKVPTLQDLIKIKGIEKTTAEQFITSLPKFFTFIDENNLQYRSFRKEFKSTEQKESLFNNQKIVFTGFRDSEFKDFIERNGGNVTDCVTKNTNLLIKKDTEEKSSKITKAKELNIKIMNYSDFNKQYMNPHKN